MFGRLLFKTIYLDFQRLYLANKTQSNIHYQVIQEKTEGKLNLWTFVTGTNLVQYLQGNVKQDTTIKTTVPPTTDIIFCTQI